ncbi:hypothetical protein CONLIGDRAFT_419830 [Coniochaeta ligniaria NRRL 30616]|uniref:Mitochondrial export translocase Oxa2 n=1 Tax=Coniochaeta ligniaria NRRL 30616 TaxID=1408157 RepID=A0A1J7J1Q0_9PEZI|nr:hypothetical protein CONLIGDRAFT_419830 [Coniochaeta ligniaria NRRL 30616]
MTVLSRLGPALGSSRPQLLRISSVTLRSHLSNESHTFRLNQSALDLKRGIPGARRNFSVANALETAVYDATQLITALHTATGTPWYITIPLAALAVNLVVRVPVTIYSRKLEQKRTRLLPLFWTWHSRHSENVSRANPGASQAALQVAIQKRSAASERRISKDHGVQSWKINLLGPITVLPFFLTAIQGVRRLCGAGGGIFGLFSNPLPDIAKTLSGKEAREEMSSTPSTSDHAVGQSPWNSDISQVGSPAAAAPAASEAPLGADLLGYEPSLSTGGCLWFPDLTVQDPYHVLPFMLSAAMLWVVLPRTLDHTRQLLDPTAINLTWRTRLHRALLVIALALGPLTMHLPAAMHIYWISSTLIATGQREVIHKVLKLPETKYQRAKGRDTLLVQPPPPPPKA